MIHSVLVLVTDLTYQLYYVRMGSMGATLYTENANYKMMSRYIEYNSCVKGYSY